MKNYRFLGDEAEILGNRLDHAREMVLKAKTIWAKHYWQNNVERLAFQWRQLPILHDGDATMTLIPRWTVDYNFYELQQEGNLYGLDDRFYNAVFHRDPDLSGSWERHRAQRLARAQ